MRGSTIARKVRNISKQLGVLVQVGYRTDIPVAQLKSVKKNDIKKHNEITSKVSITGKGNKARTLFIANDLLESIQETCNLDSEYLIYNKSGGKGHRGNAYSDMRELFIQGTGKDAHPHQLRHLYATTQIVDNNKSIKVVSKYLGHSHSYNSRYVCRRYAYEWGAIL